MRFLRDHEIKILAAVLVAVIVLAFEYIEGRIFSHHPKGWVEPAYTISDEELDAQLEAYHREVRSREATTRRDGDIAKLEAK